MSADIRQLWSRIQRDRTSLHAIIIGLLIIAGSFYPLRQFLHVEPTQSEIADLTQQTLNTARGQVQAYLSSYRDKLSGATTQSAVQALLKAGDEQALNNAEKSIKSTLNDATDVFILDAELRRHGDTPGFAALQLAYEIQKGKSGEARAIKIDNQWQVLIGHAIDNTEAGTPTRVLIARLPLVGLRYALNVVDGDIGQLQLQQHAGRYEAVQLISFGAGDSAQQQSTATASRFWKLAFAPSPNIAEHLDHGLLSFKTVYSLLVAGVLIGLYLLVHNRLRHQALVKLPELDEEKPAAPTSTLEAFGKKRRRQISTPTAVEMPEIDEQLAQEKASTQLPEEEVFELDDALLEESPEIPELVFRDCDIRGLADSEITPGFALLLGKTLGTVLLGNGHKSVYVGRDARESSEDLAQALHSGLLSTGCNVINLGQITTPMCNFAAHRGGHSSCAIMVTASHNPAEYNGFKIIIDREVIAGQTLKLIQPMLGEGKFREGEGKLLSHDIQPQYLEAISNDCPINKDFYIVADTANAIAGPVLRQLLEQLNCRFLILNEDVDGSFPSHDPDPSKEANLRQLQETVQAEQADLGLAFDGDADRVVAVTAEGRIVWPDELLMIFARDILARNPGADIVFDVKSSKRLPELIVNYSGRPVMCKTGHAHIRHAVHSNQAPLGGEFSGHIFFNDRWDGFDDGLYAAARLLEILSSREQTLSELTANFDDTVYTPEILIPISEADKFELFARIHERCTFPKAEVNEIDGLRVEYQEGWALIRPSNTSPNLTLRFEADHEMALIEIKSQFAEAVRSQIPNIDEYI